MISKIKDTINSLKRNGFFHVILSSSLVKVVSFISAIFLPRIIGDKVAFGLLSYVDNIRSYILMFNGLGVTYSIIYYCAKENNERKRSGYFASILKLGFVIDAFVVLLTIILTLVLPETFSGQKELMLASSFICVFFLFFEGIQLYLRACLKNNYYSYLNATYTVLMVVLQIAAAFFSGVTAVVWIRYLALGISVALGIVLLSKSQLYTSDYIKPDKKELLEIFKYGFITMLATASSTVMSLNETQLLAMFTVDEGIVADYKVASYMFLISTFLSQSVAICIFPYFSKNRDNKDWVWKNYKKAMLYNGVVMIFIHIALWFLAEPFVLIAFGEEYINSVVFMKLLIIASFGQTVFRMLTGNVLSAIGKQKFNLAVNIVSIIVHFAVCYLFMSRFGGYGLIAGPICVYYLSGIVMCLYLRKVLTKDIQQ